MGLETRRQHVGVGIGLLDRPVHDLGHLAGRGADLADPEQARRVDPAGPFEE